MTPPPPFKSLEEAQTAYNAVMKRLAQRGAEGSRDDAFKKLEAADETITDLRHALYEVRGELDDEKLKTKNLTTTIMQLETSLSLSRLSETEAKEKLSKIEGRKRKRDTGEAEDRTDVKRPKNVYGMVACTQCYSHSLEATCDNSPSCKNCTLRGKTCKRIKCQNFEGPCKKDTCTLAHRWDNFPQQVLLPFQKIRRTEKLEPPTAKAKKDDGEDSGEDGGVMVNA
ncbi:hypothetical protein BDV96DRAFT_681657 [Lophiotrema nucula]|uniref:C3H1-type domain-containing protein n=1 Tax=Lophiotrema nucula TaxID=690887 RepID=A0A6A5ZW15_9PLEO|nr:hypothetical protein BDV96DRAFT_681657 [Lophiotrema nucula]